MKLAFIANPWAGRGRDQSIADTLRGKSPVPGWDVSVDMTTGPGDGTRLARRLSHDADVIGVIGGDGTIHEVVNGLMPSPKPIVIFPVGTGNDYASLFRCPTDIEHLSLILNRGLAARLDVLAVGDRFCVNSAGLGFEGMVNKRSHNIKIVKGSLLYLLAVFKTLSSLQCPPFKIEAPEGVEIEGEKLLVSIGNGNRTGGAFYLTPDAAPDDGLIDLCIIDEMSWFRVIRLLPKSFSGRHTQEPEVRMLRVSSLTIDTSSDFPMHVDGELVESSPSRLVVEVLPRVLPVLCEASNKSCLLHPLEKVI